MTEPKEYFSQATRDSLRKAMRGLVDCEVSIEIIKQKIYNKIRMSYEAAFKIIDRREKGLVSLDGLREFLKSSNVFCVEKDLQMLF